MNLNGQTVFLRLEHERTGQVIFTSNRVWDIDVFLSSQVEAYSGDKVKSEDRQRVSIATESEYKTFIRKAA